MFSVSPNETQLIDSEEDETITVDETMSVGDLQQIDSTLEQQHCQQESDEDKLKDDVAFKNSLKNDSPEMLKEALLAIRIELRNVSFQRKEESRRAELEREKMKQTIDFLNRAHDEVLRRNVKPCEPPSIVHKQIKGTQETLYHAAQNDERARKEKEAERKRESHEPWPGYRDLHCDQMKLKRSFNLESNMNQSMGSAKRETNLDKDAQADVDEILTSIDIRHAQIQEELMLKLAKEREDFLQRITSRVAANPCDEVANVKNKNAPVLEANVKNKNAPADVVNVKNKNAPTNEVNVKKKNAPDHRDEQYSSDEQGSDDARGPWRYWRDPNNSGRADIYPEAQRERVEPSGDRIDDWRYWKNLYEKESAQKTIEPLEAIGAMATIFSRQEVQRLPEFKGDERDWPYFEEVYYQTTLEGRYSEAQNVKRLRNALKSPALDLVRDLLMFSADASAIMNDLRETYGRPEKVIATMLEDLLLLKSPRHQRENQLGEFAIKLKNFVASVKTMRMDSELNSEIHIGKIAAKLSDDCYRDWRKIKLRNPKANLESLSRFLMDRLKLIPPSLSRHDEQSSSRYDYNKSSNRSHGRLMTHSQEVREMPDDCLICLKRHPTTNCYKLLNADVRGRLEIARRFNICLSCLSSDRHGMRDCKKAKRCGKEGCEKYHHELLHNSYAPTTFNMNRRSAKADTVPSENTRGQISATEHSQKNVKTEHHSEPQNYYPQLNHFEQKANRETVSSSTLFKIVPIKLFGNNNISVSTYAFLDGGSSVTLMEKKLFDTLELEGLPKELTLQWTKGQTRSENSYETTILLSGVKNNKLHKLRNVHTIENLGLPTQTVNVQELKERHPHLRHLPLTDMIDAKPELLIGIQHSRLLADLKCQLGKDDEDPVAIRTELGWIVFGKTAPSFDLVAMNVQNLKAQYQFHMTEPLGMDDELHQLVKEFFTTEEFGVKAPQNPTNIRACEEDLRAQIIIDNTMKTVGGRMEIGLFWKSDDVKLPDSRPMAMSRLKSQEKALRKQPELLEWTTKHIAEMLEKGHAREASADDMQNKWKRIAYIPTFTVINKNKNPPKPRFVMDFAAKSGIDGKSVNSQLLKGPDNLAPLLSGLCKFREGKIAVNADVKEMYHQVIIKKEDQQCQRFLWRDCEVSKEPTVYILQVMAFGPTCSPSAAQAVKNFNANNFINECPEAVNSIIKHTYVDDYFNSHNDLEEAVRVTKDAIRIFDNISFPLVGVQSNSLELLASMPQQNVKPCMIGLEINSANELLSKILGMYWEPIPDVFTFKLFTNDTLNQMLDKEFHPTKREVLSVIMKVFDPLGLISHYLIRAKILLQEIWRDGTGWDDKINERLLSTWREWVTQLHNIEKLKIPRQYAPVNPTSISPQLFIFADASEMGFAATAYFRFDDSGTIHTAHVMSKTKVAPLKQLSIPKLELQAAVLAVRLAQTIKSLHSFSIRETFYATDSKVVLSWITSERLKLKQFVAPRVGEILDVSTRREWYHIRSRLNVADDGTKWADPTMGDIHTRWFQGPDFLKSKPEEWPLKAATNLQFDTEIDSQIHNDIRTPEHLTYHSQVCDREKLSFGTLNEIAQRFKSTWTSFVRIIARILRLSTKRKVKNHYNFITPQEFRRAEDMLFRKIQLDAFPDEVASLMNENKISRSSKLQNFTPIMIGGLIRLSSRAQGANTSYAARNPAILPNKHELVTMMMQHYHAENFHIGEDTTIADVRERVWVINVRSAFRRMKANCQYCKNKTAKPNMPLMGQLPPARMSFHTKPFTHVGIDCFGHYEVKFGRGKVKRWGIIFTCLTFRAVHLELLNDMSKEECLSAIRRFQARRGRSYHFYSDRGTNFIGANNELVKNKREMVEQLGEAVAQKFGVEWHFQPAYSPWWGGAWERLIQSIKKCIDFIFYGENPREDIFRNALIEAEFRMNCRPLTHVPIDQEDDQPLTPNTALFGYENENELGPGMFQEADAYSKSSYRRSQILADKLLSRWIKEYLPTITRRSKWFHEIKNVELDDIAILINPSEPRNAWRKGRITRIYPGPDGQVRAADIKLADGTIKTNRAVGRLAKLDVKKFSIDKAAENGVEDVVEPLAARYGPEQIITTSSAPFRQH